jgi:N-acetylglucosaminyldiphosphoundecaprenol N-acetyl-beta-D-mannosaminyltransferase
LTVTSLEILGCRVDAVDREEAVTRIAALAAGGSGALVVTLGVEMVMAAQRDAAFRALLNGAALSVCDTIGILLAARVRGAPLRERVTGVELVDALAARSAGDARLRLFLLGGADGTAARAAAALSARYPGVRIAGTRSGYFSDAQSPAVAQLIKESGASVLLAGLGSPKQETWIAGFGASAAFGVGIGVGGSFDVLAGNVQRAPRAIQRAGLEWAYRLMRQPSRWRRQLALPRFALAEAAEILRLKMGNRSN